MDHGDRQMDMGGQPIPSPRRLFSTAHLVDGDRLICINGCTGRRVNTIVYCRIVSRSGRWDVLPCSGTPPPPSQHHSSQQLVINNRPVIVFIGGRTNPSSPIQDVYILDLITYCWSIAVQSVVALSSRPPVRFRHAMAYDHLRQLIYIHGGLSDRGSTLNDLWRLDLNTMSWLCLTSDQQHEPNRSPSGTGRHSHTITYDPRTDQILMFGGITAFKSASRATDSTFYIYDIGSNRWSAIGDLPGPSPPAVYGHRALVVADHYLIVGGISTALYAVPFSVLHLPTMTWKPVNRQTTISVRSISLLIAHSCVIRDISDQDPEILVVGGGSQCFAFGTWYDPVIRLRLSDILSQSNQ